MVMWRARPGDKVTARRERYLPRPFLTRAPCAARRPFSLPPTIGPATGGDVHKLMTESCGSVMLLTFVGRPSATAFRPAGVQVLAGSV